MRETMDFSGRLTAFPPGDLLQWARNDRRTGALVLRRSSREKRVSFRDGQIVSCMSDDPAEFYGQHLLLNGYVSEKDLIRALTHCGRSGKRVGQALQELAILTGDTIQQTLRSHIQDLVCDLFLWQRGVFYFETEVPHEEDIPPLAVDTLHLTMEGSRWADEHERIRRVFIHDEILLRRRPAAREQGLSPLEQWILGKVNDRRTIAQLYRATGGSYFRFLQASLALCVREVLDIAEVPQQMTAATTHEINLYDLMREQASEEQVLAMHRKTTLPMAALENLVPVWMGPPPEAEPVANLAARCKGALRLKEVLGADATRELDLFVQALRDGSVALLPGTVGEIEAAADRGTAPRWWRQLFTAGAGKR